MDRITGSTTISLNVDVLASGPWDARSIIPYVSGLKDNQTLPYPYAGMVVTVYNDTEENNGIYYCTDKGGNIEFADGSSVWVKTGSGGGVTGGTYVVSAGTINFSGTTSATTFPVSGFSYVTGGTVINNTISGYTNTSGSTPVFGGIINSITGGSYSDGTITLSGSGNFSNTISGFNVLSGTGVSAFTFNTSNYDLNLTLNDTTSITRSLSILASDLRVTGGTYNPLNGEATFTNNTGGTFNVTGFLVNYTNYYTTGSTYSPSTGIITFNRTDTYPAYSATGFNYVTGFTIYSNNTLSGVTNTGQTINGGTINAVTGGTLVGGTLYLSGTGNFTSSIPGFGTLQNAEFLTGATVYSDNTISGMTNSGSSRNFGQVTSVTGGSYNKNTGIITLTGSNINSQTIEGFNYVTGFTVNPNNGISGYTNISGTSVAFGGMINAVTGGSFSNNTLYLSGTGNILSGVSITGFSTNTGMVYTGGTSTAGTGGTTNITATLIESGQTTGVTFSLSGALSFTNSNVTKREVGGIGNGSNFFETGKTLQEIIQQIFYPIDAPTITNIGKTLTKGGLTNDLYVVGTVGLVSLTATYTSGTSVAGVYTKTTGPVTSFVFSGYTSPIPAVTAYTSLNTTAYTVSSSYSVVKGYNTWTCDINYSSGEQPVYDNGTPYYGAGVAQFVSPGTVTPSNVRIEGVYPVSATTTAGNTSFTQQSLVSMITNTTLTITLAAENSLSFRQSFLLPQDLDSRFSSLGLYNSLTGNYDPVTILSLFEKTTYGTITIGGDNVTYHRYTYKIPDLTGESIYKLTFS